MNDELYHYGIKGMHWGVRRYQKKDGTLTSQGKIRRYAMQNLKNSKVQNLKKWGIDRKHNILYISGKSGSGKSTVALSLKDESTEVIHLDSYFELKNISSANKNKNSSFNSFLKSNGFDPSNLNDKKMFINDIKAYFKNVDRFQELSEKFGESCFDNGKRVIVEGVQLLDETMYPDKSFFNDKPGIVLLTEDRISKRRAFVRDSSK